MALLLIPICVMLAGLLYQAAGTALDARRYPPPGRMIGGLHLHATGEGAVTVVLEAGIAASSVSWLPVRQGIEKFARVCAYDRAGLGWSRPARTPRTLQNTAGELHRLIRDAGIAGPIILAGHSFGGMAALEYARQNPGALAGLVLVDPLPASERHAEIRRGVRLARRGALLARFGVVRLSLDLLRAGSRTIPKLAARISAGNGLSLTERLVGEVRKLPPSTWRVIQSHWCQPKSFESMASHLEYLEAGAAACPSFYDLGDLPLVVLSAANSTPDRAAAHSRIAASSSRGVKVVATQSGHWIQLDQPELVIEAVRRMVNGEPCAPSF